MPENDGDSGADRDAMVRLFNTITAAEIVSIVTFLRRCSREERSIEQRTYGQATE